MKTLIACPSLNRSDSIMKKTALLLKEIKEYDWKVFVEPHDYFLYVSNLGKNKVVKLPKRGMGLMYSLNYMRDYARNNGYDLIFQIDDDVESFARLDTDDKKSALLKTIDDLELAFSQSEKLGGVRFTQYRYWVYSKKDIKVWTHKNKPLQGVCMIRLNAIPEIHEDMKEFTDTVSTLYIWKNGFYTLNYGLSGLKVVQNANKGGCQSYDRAKDALLTIETLKKDFPLVKKKESKSWFKIDVDIDPYLDEYSVIPRYMVDLADIEKI